MSTVYDCKQPAMKEKMKKWEKEESVDDFIADVEWKLISFDRDTNYYINVFFSAKLYLRSRHNYVFVCLTEIY